MLLLGVAKGSAIVFGSSASSESSAQLSKSLRGVNCALAPAAMRAAAMACAISVPVLMGDAPNTKLPRSTITPRAMPVSDGGSEPSEAARAARFFTASNTRERWCRMRNWICCVSSACRCAAPSTMPGRRAVDSSRGVVLRTARLHTQTTSFAVPLSGWHLRGARRQAWSVELLASLVLRTSPTWQTMWFLESRHRHVTIFGTRASDVTTRLEIASADLTALRHEMSTRSAFLLTFTPSGAWPSSVSTAAELAIVLLCVIIMRRMEAY